jgi:hypothetical protein
LAHPCRVRKPQQLQTCFAEGERRTEGSGPVTEVQAEPASTSRKGLFFALALLGCSCPITQFCCTVHPLVFASEHFTHVFLKFFVA